MFGFAVLSNFSGQFLEFSQVCQFVLDTFYLMRVQHLFWFRLCSNDTMFFLFFIIRPIVKVIV